ncbi:1-hydroxycarotenoid 3,4-desaturase CrtD [Falsiroseomonas selenitidurans]|uniref:Phytoene desaturase n=1 Tax=Falsiroseomonas selenitidurans TaxID=2716335 RepID=A0ABX1EAT7_9PROT|nr:1-hydroxycarotenoid 3,4-desaturase CrtD [Falsiroseomonas selenitidurans]NKC33960.1 phytoene desaturase [Falsiroseomonas selenitidurans]
MRVVVIGAGMGGLAAAADLARQGAEVTVLERAAAAGGKMRHVQAGGAAIDGGPTVFTMRWIFAGLFADAGQRLEDVLELHQADILARHAWRAGGRLDLFASVARSADAIGDFAGAQDAQGFRDFAARSADIFGTLRDSFIAAQRPSPLDLVRRVGRLEALWRTAPWATLWQALGTHFTDPRLRQLFGRYATYCGCSPLLAPATLMLVAHVEQDGVWLVRGGMRRVAQAVQALAESQGARFRFNTPVLDILVQGGRAAGVRLEDGEVLQADAVVFNGDVAALGQGLLGGAARRAARDTPRAARSLSAVTWCMNAATHGFPLSHHNVFFAEDYAAEFAAIFRARRITAAPTVYICAQDRGQADVPAGAPERLLLLVNAPADGDLSELTPDARDELQQRSLDLLRRCGLVIEATAANTTTTTPAGFHDLFPGTGGALYGRASHGATGTFARPGAASRLPGLFLAGGSVHPGPGVPMAAMSGRLAAARVLAGVSRRSSPR